MKTGFICHDSTGIRRACFLGRVRENNSRNWMRLQILISDDMVMMMMMLMLRLLTSVPSRPTRQSSQSVASTGALVTASSLPLPLHPALPPVFHLAKCHPHGPSSANAVILLHGSKREKTLNCSVTFHLQCKWVHRTNSETPE